MFELITELCVGSPVAVEFCVLEAVAIVDQCTIDGIIQHDGETVEGTKNMEYFEVQYCTERE